MDKKKDSQIITCLVQGLPATRYRIGFRDLWTDGMWKLNVYLDLKPSAVSMFNSQDSLLRTSEQRW